MQNGSPRDSPEAQPPGVVELREDVPLKAGAGGGGGPWCARGPRLILIAFATLTAAITLALLTQIYYGDYEIVPHGAASSSAAACSRAGTDALKAGGRALDAALAAALCLAVVAPHRTSLDASGSLLYWEYRQSRTQQPSLIEWGGPSVAPPAALAVAGEGAEAGAGKAAGAGERAGADAGVGASEGTRPPRLVAALAALHAELGALPWPRLLQPAIDLAKDGFQVSEGLASVDSSLVADSRRTAPELASYLEGLQHNTSAELSVSWGAASVVRRVAPRVMAAGGWRAWAGGAGAGAALAALAAALQAPTDIDDASARVVESLQQAASAGASWPPAGVATGLAVVDRLDTYLALVTGLSMPFGNGAATAEGWTRDEPTAPLDLAPAIITDEHICGTRYVVGAESWGALAQAGAALAVGADGGAAVERARVVVQRGAALALEARRPLPAPAALPAAPAATPAPALNASLPYAAVNIVQQRADQLLSHADSRGGGLASRF